MDEKAAEALNTSLAAGRILSIGAQRLSSSLDSFSGWLLAGFGALFGLLVSNIDTLTPHMDISRLKTGAEVFLVAASLAALQKLIAAYVAAGTAAGEDGRAIGKELAAGTASLNIESMYQQISHGLLWPWRSFNARAVQKAKAGDHAVVGRFHAKASQVQCYLVVLQSICSIGAAAFVVSGIAI